MKRLAIVGLCAASLASGAMAQSAETPAQENSAATQKERTDAFLNGRAEAQRQRLQKLGSLSSVVSQLNALVKTVGLRSPSPAFVQDAEQKRRLAESFITDVTQELTVLGFKPGTGKILTGGGIPLVKAAAARVRGTATLRDYSLLADSLVVGKVTKINNSDDRQDGYLSTATITVERSYSTGIAVGDTIDLRRRSGEASQKKVDSSIEAPLAEGDQILLVGSKAYYANSSAKPAGNTAVELIPFYRVDGDQLTPSAPFQMPATFTEISK